VTTIAFRLHTRPHIHGITVLYVRIIESMLPIRSFVHWYAERISHLLLVDCGRLWIGVRLVARESLVRWQVQDEDIAFVGNRERKECWWLLVLYTVGPGLVRVWS